MSKRDDGGRMKPMYRTAAEEALILAAIKERRTWRAFGKESSPRSTTITKTHGAWMDAEDAYDDAVRAVVRERGKKR